jgi:hypothetical protein
MSANSGGPAFPLQSIGPEFSPGYSGMTLRDYFAAKALPAYFSDGTGHANFDAASDWAYTMADAMLKARQA